MLEIKDLTVSFNINTSNQKEVLKKFNLKVEQGEFVMILGSNGAGKSTLFNSILGTIPYTGSITLNNQNIDKLPQYKRSKFIGIVYQDPLRGTSPNLTVLENIMISSKSTKPLYQRNKTRKQEIERIQKYGLNLENELDSQAKQLSGGQRQALTLYMTINNIPDLLLLDEHTAALDPKTQDTIMEITNNVVKDSNITTLMITHNLRTALKYGSRLIILNEGKVVVDLNQEQKENMSEEEIIRLYSKEFSDKTLFQE